MSVTYTKLTDGIQRMRTQWKKNKTGVMVPNESPYVSNQEAEVPQEQQSPLFRQKKFQNEKVEVEADVDYEHYDQYLNSITTSIDCEKDLKLYKIQHAYSNLLMSMIGVEVLCSNLQEAYGNSQYLIRCYHKNTKFFEMPLQSKPYFIELFNDKIVYLFEDDISQINIIQVEVPLSLKEGTYDINEFKNKKVKKSSTTQDFVMDIDEIQQIKLGHFTGNDCLKVLFITHSNIYMVPMSIEDQQNQSTLFSKNRKEIDNFDFGKKDPAKFDGLPNNNDDDDQRSVNLSSSSFEDEEKQIKHFFDFGVNPDSSGNYDEEQNEIVAALDHCDNLHIFRGINYGKRFTRLCKVPLKMNSSKVKYRKVLDALLISNSKIITLETVVYTSKQPNIAQQEWINTLFTIKNKIRLQVWEFDKDTEGNITRLDKSISQKIHTGFINSSFLQSWKKDIFFDYFNNDFYLPNYSINSNTYYKLKINNDSPKAFESTILTEDIIKDIIGSHQWQPHLNISVKGKTYSDFIVFDRLLIISHGRFISISDITNQKMSTIQQHLEINNRNQKDPHDYYNMSNDVYSVEMSDKVTPNNEYRWKIVIFYKNGEIQELVRLQQHLGQSNDPSQFRLIKQIPNPISYELKSYLRNQKGQNTQLPGQIVKVFKHFNNPLPILLFLVKLPDKTLSLCTIEYYQQTLREFHVKDLTDKSTVIVLGLDRNPNFLNIMIVNQQLDENNNIVEQQKQIIRIRTNFHSYDKDNVLSIIEQDNMPKDMKNVADAAKILVYEQVIYFIYQDAIEKFYIETGEMERVATSDYFAAIHISENSFTYWRQSHRNKQVISLESSLLFDQLETLAEMKSKSMNKDYTIFNGLYPHLDQIYYDSTSESLAAFVDYNTIKVWPLLHHTKIKLKGCGKRKTDIQVIASKLIDHKLYTLHSDNTANEWNIKSGKLINTTIIHGLEGYIFHQSFNSDYVMLRSIDVRDTSYHSTISNAMTQKLSKLQSEMSNAQGSSGRHNGFQQMDSSQQCGIQGKFKIGTLNKQIVQIADYKVLSISRRSSSNESDIVSISSIDHSEEKGATKFGNAVISEVISFEGPCETQSNNYGLLASSNLEMFKFFFRDPSGNLLLYYYTKVELKDQPKRVILVYQCQANANMTYIPQHSKNFEYHLQKEFLSGNTKLAYYNEHKVPLDEEKKNQIDKYNQHLQQICDQAEGEPCFISDQEVILIDNDNILSVYNVFDTQIKANFTKCPYFGTKDSQQLDMIIKTGYHILGQDLMIFEQNLEKVNILDDNELVAPNNFNQFFKEISYTVASKTTEDVEQAKYIQTHYKTKIEILPRCHYGYIYQAKEFLSTDSYESDIYLVSSFSYYHWRCINHIKKQDLSIDDVDQQLLKELCFTQLPDGSTLLHHIMFNYKFVDTLFTSIKEQNNSKQEFYVPIFQDNQGKTVFDYLFKKSDTNNAQIDNKENKRYLLKSQKVVASDIKKIAFYILHNMADYPFDAFKLRIRHLVKPMMEADIDAFTQFLNSRCKPLKAYSDITTAKSKNKSVRIFASDNAVYQRNLDVSKIMQSNSSDTTSVQIKVLDMPKIHYYSSSAYTKFNTLNEIYDALADCENSKVYQNDVIKAFIEVKWRQIKLWIIIFLMCPYLILMALLMTYVAKDLESSQSNIKNNTSYMSKCIRNAIFSILSYFFCLEFFLLIKNPLFYIKKKWHYIDVIIFVLIIIAESLLGHCRDLDMQSLSYEEDFNKCGEDDKAIRTIYAFVMLLTFARCLYFFRVFRATGYYIRMFIQVILNIWYFVFIYLFVVIAFAFAFYTFEQNGSNGPTLGTMQSALSFSYLSAFGNYDTSIFSDYHLGISWLFFMLLNLLIQIVLMNLLISIVSETFTEIKENYNVIMYQDMLVLINENKYFTYFSRIYRIYYKIFPRKYKLSKRYLLFSSPIVENGAQDNANIEKIISQRYQLQKLMKENKENKKSKQLFERMEEKNKQIMDKLDMMMAQNKQ